MTEPDLDAAFLEYFRSPDPEARRKIHGAYVALFDGRHSVVDLACGEGEMVGFLTAAGHDALGVDADAGCVTRATAMGRKVVHADAGEWLAAQPEASIDGLFNSHLVEHLDFEAVLELYRQAIRVLTPDGILVTVTPNVRSLYCHLETFYKHFGHVRFYHPELLAFFARYVGFELSEMGENPHLVGRLFGRTLESRTVPGTGTESERESALAPLRLPRYSPDLPRGKGAVRGWWWQAKMALVRLLVRPYLDPLVEDLHSSLVDLHAQQRRLALLVEDAEGASQQARTALAEAGARIDRPVEAYVVSHKNRATSVGRAPVK